MGIPFKDALAAYVEVNRLNTPSFEGGALIAKTRGARVTKTKAEKRAAKLAKEAEGMMQKAFGAHPPAVVQRAVAQLLVADNDYRVRPNEFTKRALDEANQHARQVILYSQATRITPPGSHVPGSAMQLLAAR